MAKTPLPPSSVTMATTPLPPSSVTMATTPTVKDRLPSSAISKEGLTSVCDVIKDSADLLRKDGKMGTMAVVLAREAYFGEDVMRQCAVKGYGEKPGLPLAELMQLKEELCRLYPHFLRSPAEFEVNVCDSLSQACKRLKRKAGNQ